MHHPIPNTPTSGTYENDLHTLPVRVYYENTDCAGIVYHAEYLRFFERARTEFLRHHGITYTCLRAQPGAPVFVVYDMHIQFKKPAQMDDSLVVKTTVHKTTAMRLILEQKLYRGDELLVAALVQVACLNDKGRPTRHGLAF